MKLQRLSIILAVINFGLLLFLLLAHSRLADGVAPVIRCRALQVVDEQGRVRAGISVLPASTFKPTGKAYPETVILRLIDANGRPEVKIAASEEGAGLGFVGKTDETQVKLEAQGAESSLTLINKDGKEQRVKPSSE
jgi:hypothetical protein